LPLIAELCFDDLVVVVVVAAAAVAVVVKTALSTFDRQVVNFEV